MQTADDMPTVKLRHFDPSRRSNKAGHASDSAMSKKNSNSGSTVVDLERFAAISGIDSFDENASTPMLTHITLKTNKISPVELHEKALGTLNFDKNRVEDL